MTSENQGKAPSTGRQFPRRLTVVAFLVGLSIPVGVAAAYAATASSSWMNTGTVNGYSYKNQAQVDNSYTAASTNVATTDESNAPAGYMGAWAGLYESNGTLCKQSSWFYNPVSAAGESTVTNGSYCGAGNYYSYGRSEAYTGSGYDAYYTYLSPDLAFS